MLKPGGIWIDSGPLLYRSAPSVPLSLNEIVSAAVKMDLSSCLPGRCVGS
jgi:N2227-like protein